MSRVLVLLLAMFAPALARAQAYECAGSFGTNCRTSLLDGYQRYQEEQLAGSVSSTLLVLPGACEQEDRIVDVDLSVHLLHPYVGDLEVTLTHPDGTSIAVLYRPGISVLDGFCPNDDVDVTFDDDDGAKLVDMCLSTIPAIRGSVLPFNPLSQFDGKTRNGTWTLTVRDHVPGSEGVLAGWKLALPCVPDLPDVTIDTTDALAAERGSDDRAVVTVARGGDTGRALRVAYSITGSASLADFEPLPGTIEIPVGAASAEIEIRPVADDKNELEETIVLTLQPGADYEIGARDTAIVTLVDDDEALAAGSGGGPSSGAGGLNGAAGRGGSASDRDAGEDAPDGGGTTHGRPGNGESDDCGCRVPGATASEPPLALIGLASLLVMFAARRRHRR